MINQGKDPKCQFWCWAIAAIAGVLIFLMLLSVAGKSFIASLILGAIAFALLGLLFNWLFCAPVPALGEGTSAASRSTGTAAAAGAATAAVAGGVAAGSSARSANSGTSAASASAASASTSTATSSAPSADATADKAAADAKAEADAKAKADKAAADAKAAADKAASDKAAADAQAKADEAEAAAKAKADEAAKQAAADEKAAADKKAAEKKAADKKAAAAKAKADKAAAEKAAAGEDFDGDGKLEGENEGSKPELLTAARAGGADDLKRIKGIGPKLEGVCNDMGVYHFDQIAAWTADEMAWVNANLQGFKGRATRDDWVGQAKLLAAGGETEFSKRVDKGSVY